MGVLASKRKNSGGYQVNILSSLRLRLLKSRLWRLSGQRLRGLVLVLVLATVLLGVGFFPPSARALMLSEVNRQSSIDPSAVSTPEEVPIVSGSPADAGDIPSETVGRFVSAYLAVVDLIESKEASLQRAETDTESRQMQEEIQRQAIGLIKDHNLTLQAYWELLELANSDPEFRERVLAQVEEASL